MTTHLEEFDDGLACKLIDHVKRTWSVGGTGIIAQIDVVVLGKQLPDTVQNGQPTVSAVEDTDRAWCFG